MKKFYFLLTIVFFAFAANAQYIYTDFDANQNEIFSGWPNQVQVVTNPDASGVNTSAMVGQWQRSTEQYANIYCELDGNIDFSTGETFYLKVWSPIACDVLFKLEDQNNSSVFVENMQSVSTPNQWVQLAFDFTGAASETYNKIVIFMDFSTTTDNTFFFDDVEGPEYEGGIIPGDPVTLPVTFDDENVNYNLVDFGGNISEIVEDPTNATNMVVKTIKTDGAELWAGTTIGGTAGFANPIPFEPGSTNMTVKIWSPDANIPIRLKAEDPNDPTVSVETETMTTVAEDWETLTFDFSNEASGTNPINFANTYQKLSVFFNFGTTGATAGEKTYYWDDVAFEGGTGPKPLMEADVQDNFENDGYSTIDTWQFQDPDLVDITIVEDPVNPANHVMDYYRSGTFEWTNAQFILDFRMDLSTRNVFEAKAFFPSSNDYSGDLTPTLALKLQNSLLGGNAYQTQTEIKIPVDTFDEWVTLQFDFSIVADSVNYDQVVVQFGGEGHFVPGQFYLDDLQLLNPVSITENTSRELALYPNPASEYINIANHDQLSRFEMYNMNGARVIHFQNDVPQHISVGNLPAGLYTVKALDSKEGIYTTKLMVR